MNSIFLKTNVTTIKFVDRYLFAGIGSELHVFEIESKWKKIVRLKIFSSQNLHGIVSKEDKILLYGGRELAVVRCKLKTNELKLERNYLFVDWILDSIYLDSEPHIAILTANNTLHKFNLSSGLSIDRIKCQDICILYSGKILNSAWDHLIILAGTVYQEIIVWQFSPDENISHTLHRLKGHKGVIFSINYDSNSNLICSTSDDRTLRIWKVESIQNEKTINWKRCNIFLKISIFCHQARVWRSRVISENKVISIGEDSMICIWNESGHCVNHWHGHQGSAIWSVDYSNELGLIATGGGDGGINIWPLSESLEPYIIYQSIPTREETIPRSVILTYCGGIVLITNQGIFKYYLDDQWHTFGEDKRFASYCIVQASPNKRNLAFANIAGDLLLCEVDVENIVIALDIHIIEGRVFSLIWLTDSIFITCGSDGSLILWEFVHETGAKYLNQIGKHSLPVSKERWITSALIFNDEYLLCGDRCGSIHLYNLLSTNMAPINSLRKLHGYKGVTCIKLICDRIISTGRDGTYRHLSIVDNNIKAIDCNKLQMEWIAKIEETSKFGAIIVGFHDTQLILWSCKEGRPLFKMECGGGHRSWDWLLDEAGNYLSVAFIKDKCVYKYYNSLNLICHQTVETGYHSKSINSACLLANNRGRFILTGGEDNTLRLFRWESKSFIPQVTLHRHISSIRAISAIEDNGSYFVASCGGRGQLIMWQFLECEDTHRITEIASHMVRPSDKGNNKNSKHALPLPDPETRYMDVNIVRQTVNNFLILAGCSDGFFRIFEFNSQTNKIYIKKVLDDCNEHCILKVAHFIWNDNILAMTMATDGKLSFWNVTSLLEKAELSPAKPKSYRLHNLGINSYSFILRQDTLILATGSDDSSFSISVFNLMQNDGHVLLTSWIERNLHTCQISGIQIMNDFIITVGLDQRISLLKWKLSNDQLTVSLVRQHLTSVPDVHGLTVWNNQQSKYYHSNLWLRSRNISCKN